MGKVKGFFVERNGDITRAYYLHYHDVGGGADSVSRLVTPVHNGLGQVLPYRHHFNNASTLC